MFSLAEYNFIKFHGVIQNLLILIGYKKEDINKPGTNVLNWREVRKTLFNEKLLENLFSYEFEGPKDQPVLNYAYINRIRARVELISNFFLN